MTPSISADIRSTLPFLARDQGTRPTCLAFAASDAHSSARQTGLLFSAEHCFYSAHLRAGTDPRRGADLRTTLSVIADKGQILEAEWPYLTSLPASLADWSPPAGVHQFFTQLSESIPATVTEVMQRIEKGQPILLTLRLSDAFYMPDEDGVVDQHGAEQADPLRRHAVVGVGTGTRGSQRMILVRNSWGATWGLDGHGWLTEAYLNPRIDTAHSFIGEQHVSSN